VVVPHDPAVPPAAYEEAGATWVVVGPASPEEGWLSRLRTVVEAGPPRG
jgi:hypothetical protein